MCPYLHLHRCGRPQRSLLQPVHQVGRGPAQPLGGQPLVLGVEVNVVIHGHRHEHILQLRVGDGAQLRSLLPPAITTTTTSITTMVIITSVT